MTARSDSRHGGKLFLLFLLLPPHILYQWSNGKCMSPFIGYCHRYAPRDRIPTDGRHMIFVPNKHLKLLAAAAAAAANEINCLRFFFFSAVTTFSCTHSQFEFGDSYTSHAWYAPHSAHTYTYTYILRTINDMRTKLNTCTIYIYHSKCPIVRLWANRLYTTDIYVSKCVCVASAFVISPMPLLLLYVYVSIALPPAPRATMAKC